MSAAPADPSAPSVFDSVNPAHPHSNDAALSGDPAARLEVRINALIELCRALDRKQREQTAVAERLAEDNAKLRRILQHTHQQIQELTDQIRMMEQ